MKLEKMIDDYFRCRWLGLYLIKMLRKQKMERKCLICDCMHTLHYRYSASAC